MPSITAGKLMSFVLLLAALLAPPSWAQQSTAPTITIPLAPVSDKDFVSGLEISKDDKGRWIVTFEYGFAGSSPSPTKSLVVAWADGETPLAPNSRYLGIGATFWPRAGTYRTSVELTRPSAHGTYPTKWVVAKLVEKTANEEKILSVQSIPHVVEWPDLDTYSKDLEVRSKPTHEVVKHATEMIDDGHQLALSSAKRLLERLLLKDPNAHGAYLQLARVAMKSKWGPEGLREAEVLVASALQIKPRDPDSLMMQGYVYTHQKRFREADEAFLQASASNPPNPWLWMSWGELRSMEGKPKLAMELYRKAIDFPMAANSNDRARRFAYDALLELLQERKGLDEMQMLHEKRLQEYKSTDPCLKSAYAKFRLHHRGDVDGAIDLAQQALSGGCSETTAKQTLGLALYVGWASTNGAGRSEKLNRARVYFPSSASLLYELSTSEKAFDAAKQLVAGGEQIDQVDNQRMSALAHALSSKDYEAAGRLMKLGARADRSGGPGALPAGFIPVLAADYDGIRWLRRFGVDFSKLSYQGVTAVQYAVRTGDKKLIQAVSNAKTGA
jgi:tetratricopeptide (TPR) repeat protein